MPANLAVSKAVNTSFKLLDIHIDPGWKLIVEAHALLPAFLIVSVLGFLLYRLWRDGAGLRQLEFDGADFALDGKTTFKFKPNWVDRQVAYAIWVELSTRKIGLPIDFENDVIEEVYDSWHAFFGLTRELIKTIPVSKAANIDTQEIIRLSVAVLNDGLRPHLTKWQARFRRWYTAELVKPENSNIEPQVIQRSFPQWNALKHDMQRMNKGMVNYRDAMLKIVKGRSNS